MALGAVAPRDAPNLVRALFDAAGEARQLAAGFPAPMECRERERS
jgi:hypothetical protein